MSAVPNRSHERVARRDCRRGGVGAQDHEEMDVAPCVTAASSERTAEHGRTDALVGNEPRVGVIDPFR